MRRITGQAWVLQRIISDYERGVLSALETDFPDVEHAGCFFHFTEAIYRNVCENQLERPYEENEAVKRIIRLLMASAYLPGNHVCDATSQLLQESEVTEATRQFPVLVKIHQYFHRTWIMTSPQSSGMCVTAPNNCAPQTFVKAGIARGIVKFNGIPQISGPPCDFLSNSNEKPRIILLWPREDFVPRPCTKNGETLTKEYKP